MRLIIVMLQVWELGVARFTDWMVLGSILIRLSFFLFAGIGSRSVE